MRPDVQEAIDRVFQIEQDRTSNLWDSTASSVLTRLNVAGRARDRLAPAASAKEMQRLIDEKAKKIVAGIKTVFESHNVRPGDADRIWLLRKLEEVLLADVEHGKFVLSKVHGALAAGLIEGKAFLESTGAQNRLESLHHFDMILVAMSNTPKDRDGERPITVVGSSNVQIGSGNTQSGDSAVGSNFATAAPPVARKWHREPVAWFWTVIGLIVGGLAVAYLVKRFGLN
jgi:hypothetical protein